MLDQIGQRTAFRALPGRHHAARRQPFLNVPDHLKFGAPAGPIAVVARHRRVFLDIQIAFRHWVPSFVCSAKESLKQNIKKPESQFVFFELRRIAELRPQFDVGPIGKKQLRKDRKWLSAIAEAIAAFFLSGADFAFAECGGQKE